jgi:hypothetical protein
MEQLGSHWTDFDETWYLRFCQKSVDRIQVSLQSDKNNGYFTGRCFHIHDNISLLFFEWKIFQTKLADKIKIHNLCCLTFFRKSCRLWDNIKKCGVAREAAVDNMASRCMLRE